MQDDALPAEVATFLRQAKSTFAAEGPAPGRELRLLFDTGIPPVAPTPTRRPSMLRSKIATVPGKLALAATGLTFAFSGLAAANALPTPVQQVASDLGDVVGVAVPVPDDSASSPADDSATPSTDDSATPPRDDTATPVKDDTATPVRDDTATPSKDDTATPSKDDTSTPPTGGTAVLPPPATSATEAAHIHDFDAACGSHGKYVSSVARNGNEPSCATSTRGGTTTTSTTTAGGGGPDAAGTAQPTEADRAGEHKPAKASDSGGSQGQHGKA